jgi:tetratricopeptide (TPR) repeat protein
MPLVDLPAGEAIQIRKANPVADWGNRESGNRVEPIAKPAFDAPFRFEPGETILTIGSCFARNIELELHKRGFRIPAIDFLERPQLRDGGGQMLNNYGTPSIYNELAWALGERPFVLADHVVEMSEGKFADLHMNPAAKPVALEVIAERRAAIRDLYRSVTESRVVIMTLGLAEVWYDTRTGGYVNVAPRPTALKNEPERFRLHVLSFGEAYDHLDQALKLIQRHGRADVRVILTVSPVPMAITHRSQDVIVANTYSKAVLRAAAETAACQYEFVTYFPSYETCVLSDRMYAWESDLVHVTPQIVAFNVRRLLDRYYGEESPGDGYEAEIEAGGAPAAVDWARRKRSSPMDEGAAFFERYAAFGSEAPEFALEHASFLDECGDPEAALEVVDRAISTARPGRGDLELAMLKSEVLRKLKRAQEAVDVLEHHATRRQFHARLWQKLLEAAIDTNRPALVLDVLERNLAVMPASTSARRAQVGRWFFTRGDHATATGLFEAALAFDPSDAGARIRYAELLIAEGKLDEARRWCDGAVPAHPGDEALFLRLKRALADAPSIGG